MRFSQIVAPLAGLIALVQAGETVTVVTTDYETYCPSPTTFAYHNVTYTATTATTITITNCPCTVTYSTPDCVTSTYYPPTTLYGTGSSYVSHVETITYPGTTLTCSTPTVITYTPPPTTYIEGTTPVGVPTNTPVGPTYNVPVPTTTAPVVVETGAGSKAAPAGVLLIAGLAAFAL